MEEKVQKNFFVFAIIAFELGVAIQFLTIFNGIHDLGSECVSKHPKDST